jgi:hypothetical protein
MEGIAGGMADGQEVANHDGLARVVDVEGGANRAQVYVENKEKKAQRDKH